MSDTNHSSVAGRPASEGDKSRRNFIKGSSVLLAGGAIAGSQLSVARGAHAYGSDTIKIGLVGCGGRGTGAAIQALNTSGGEVKLVAMADVFENNIESAEKNILREHGASKLDVADTKFAGIDAFEKVIDTDADIIFLATPPGFRPQHFEAAVNAGKNVFMEKPVAVDAPGVRRVLAAGKLAEEKGLTVQVGLQRHHEFRYKECIERLHEGAIGDFIMARAYWNGAGVWVRPRQPEMTELEYQMKNWYYFTWLSGDHIDEQHIHNLDVINWLMDGHPVECQGQGGREVRDGIENGEIFDHHMVEYTYGDTKYGNGVKMLSQCRHQRGCWNSVSEHVHGTKGYCDISKAIIYKPDGSVAWESDAQEVNGKGHQQEHHDLFASLRRGETPNETEYGAHSTMTAIMGRMATYGGKVVTWDKAINSEISLADTDAMTNFDSEAPIKPDENGRYAVAIPGETKVI